MKSETKQEDLIVERIKNLVFKESHTSNKKITPYMISKKGNFNPRTLNHILNGYAKNPKISTIYKICAGLNISIYDFFNDDLFK